MLKKPTGLSYAATAILFVLVVSIAIPPLHSTDSAAAVSGEPFSPTSEASVEDWDTLVGVGTLFYYPPDWQARPYQAQGGVRDGATYEFVWTDARGVAARIEVLEIVNQDSGAMAMASEVSHWQRYGNRGDYSLKQLTVQGRSVWWMRVMESQGSSLRLVGVMWMEGDRRVYRFRLHSRAEAEEESEQVLRQMLSALETTVVDWSRAAGPPPVFSGGDVTSGAEIAPVALTGIPYRRSAAYAYAESYYDVQDNDDGCYLWYNGSTLDCTYHDGDWGVDGAHFVNRAVHAGGRPIPGLWDGAALRVADLRDWLVSDGWTEATASQAEVGDVAIMGPFEDPCWVGLVVSTGSDPTLATHSGEYWLPASQLYCYSGGQQTYEKTYLHVNVELKVYLPVVLRGYPPPPPMKAFAGIHLGNHEVGDWTDEELSLIDGDAGGVWPRVIVVQSKQVWNVWRPTESPCEVAGAGVRDDRANVYDYLTRAARKGVTIIIRIAPSPGNFEEAILPGWSDPDIVPTRTLITQPGVTPGGADYCGANWEKFRAVDDIVREMDTIHTRNQINGWPADCCYFEPANEPNLEWYPNRTDPPIDSVEAWQAMDDYFAALIAYARENYPALRILTPPMSQGWYAEGVDWLKGYPDDDPCPKQLVEGKWKGYELMPKTYGWRTDGYHGYSWHNYYIQGWESYSSCWYHGFHVSYNFPEFMIREIVLNDRPAFVTETDLCSWFSDGSGQCYNNNPIHGKEDDPAATSASLGYFFATESNLGSADGVVLWLLKNDEAEREEYDWHEAYSDATLDYYNWFVQWWEETP